MNVKNIFVLIGLIFFSKTSFGQHKLRWNLKAATDMELVPIVSYKGHNSSNFVINSLDAASFELGLGALYGELEDCMLIGDWFYIAPFVTGEITSPVKSELINRDIYSINVGVSAARGVTFLLLSGGLHGSVAYSTDFQNSYLKYELGFGCKRLYVGIGNYIHLSSKSDINKHYQADGFVSTKFILWGKGSGYY